MHQPVGEEDHALWEVVLGQPRHHPLLLHVWPSRDVEDHVAQVLPVPRERIFQGPALAQCKPPTAQQPTPLAFPRTPKKLEELDPETREYWRLLRKHNIWRHNRLSKNQKF